MAYVRNSICKNSVDKAIMNINKKPSSFQTSKTRPYRENNGLTICILNNGCSENKMDCAEMKEFFLKNGWFITNDLASADIVFFNSCGVTSVRENTSLDMLSEIKKHKKQSAEIIVWGCLPKINKERLCEEHKDIIIFDLDEAEHLEDYFEGEVRFKDIEANYLVTSRGGLSRRGHYNLEYLKNLLRFPIYFLRRRGGHILNRGSALVSFIDPDIFSIRVSTGCLSACTYCGVRFSRGKLESQPLHKIVAQFKKGLEKGFRKFTLIGTDLGAYGKDQGTDLTSLLSNLLEDHRDFELLLPNINPRWLQTMLPDMKNLVKSQKIVVIGAGVQSGSNRMLRLMNRGYNSEDFKEALTSLKETFPALRLRTNIIVGFPSETEEDFHDTLRLLNEIDFTFADVHRYSPRSKTKAANMSGQLTEEVIEERFQRLLSCFAERLHKSNYGLKDQLP